MNCIRKKCDICFYHKFIFNFKSLNCKCNINICKRCFKLLDYKCPMCRVTIIPSAPPPPPIVRIENVSDENVNKSVSDVSDETSNCNIYKCYCFHFIVLTFRSLILSSIFIWLYYVFIIIFRWNDVLGNYKYLACCLFWFLPLYL